MNDLTSLQARRPASGLGSNSNIGAKLRAYYGAVEDQPIPDKFLELLEKLDEAERGGKAKDKES